MAGKKPGRKRHSALKRELANFWPPPPRDTVALPLVDGFAPFIGGFAPKRFCNGCPAAESVDQGCMFMSHAHSIRNIFGYVKRHPSEDSFGDQPNLLRHAPRMPKKDEFDPYDVEIGVRLRKTRKALGYPEMKAFVDDTGTDVDNLGNWERGAVTTPVWYIRRLKGLFGVRFDWIYDEDATLMDPSLAKKMLSVDRRQKPAPRRRSKKPAP